MTNQTIESLCDVNPEAIGGGTLPSFEFDYVDISSVHSGTIYWGQLSRYSLSTAPSRARRIVRDGDVLLCTVRPGLKAHGRIQGRAGRPTVASTGFGVLRPRLDTDSGFIFHQLFSASIASQLRSLEVGSNYPAVNERDVRGLRVRCPAPEARARIGAILDLVDAAIEDTAAVIAKFRQVRVGLLHDLVTDGIDQRVTRPLISAAAVRFSSVNKKSEFGEAPVRLCNYTDVYNNTYIDAAMAFMQATATRPEIDRFGLRCGDVIITKDSETPNDIGVPAVVDSTAPDIVCGYHLALIRPDLRTLDPLFLAMQFSHSRLMRYFGQQANGSTRYGLSSRAIEQAPILDLPRDEQKRRSDVLREHDRAAAAVALELQKLRSIKAGTMEDLLSGRVPVSVPEGIEVTA